MLVDVSNLIPLYLKKFTVLLIRSDSLNQSRGMGLNKTSVLYRVGMAIGAIPILSNAFILALFVAVDSPLPRFELFFVHFIERLLVADSAYSTNFLFLT